jgi:hypothetical protein
MKENKMSQTTINQVTDTRSRVSSGAADSGWNTLYKIAGVSALMAVALIPVQIIVYTIWGIPETAIDSFMLFQDNKLVGLLVLELPYIISNILSVPIYLAFYIALRRENEAMMAIATALGLIAIAIVFAARPTFDMLYLSQQYAAATTEAQRAVLLAAGEAKLALVYGTAQQVHYVLGGVALLLVSIVMLRSSIFSKATAYVGVFANLLVFGLYVPTIGVYLSIFSVFPFLTLWLILTGRRFLQLGSGKTDHFQTTKNLPVTGLQTRNEGI